MPYTKKSTLPETVKDALPPHGEEIYKEAFNSAWDQYKDPGKRKKGGSREETAHRVAWAAVKNVYEKNEQTGTWEKKSE